MNLSEMDATQLRGPDLYSNDDEKVGEVEDVFIDEQAGRPEWLRLSVGLFGTKNVLVPFEAVTHKGSGLKVVYSKEMIKDGPKIDGDYVPPERESELYRYYGLAAVSPSELNEARGAPSDPKAEREPVVGLERPAASRSPSPSVPEEEALGSSDTVDNPRRRRLTRWLG